MPQALREKGRGIPEERAGLYAAQPARRGFTRNHIHVAGIDAEWQADLADMQGIARQNGGIMYLLTVIDVFSKFAWAVPVHSNKAKAITEAFDQSTMCLS